MTYRCRAIAASVLTLIAVSSIGLVTTTRAEVSVRTDRGGKYVRTQVIPAGDAWNPKIWSVRSRGVRFRALNPRGDMNGDLWPTVVDSSRAPYHPWAVWSQNQGNTYKLVWSHWTDRGWSDTRQIARTPGSQFDPDLTFDPAGRPYVVWWARDPVTRRGDIYVSVFLVQRWMEPAKITRGTVDARYPSLDVEEDGRVRITYYTPNGVVAQYLSIALPVTITDDINPQVVSEGMSFKANKPN